MLILQALHGLSGDGEQAPFVLLSFLNERGIHVSLRACAFLVDT
jgi:hypothetical protein